MSKGRVRTQVTSWRMRSADVQVSGDFCPKCHRGAAFKKVRYDEWLNAELERLLNGGVDACILTQDHSRYIALFRYDDRPIFRER